jgi:D-alanyl-lipoteichoic acid acyltransferase DltB (MBOAT superfamily)
MTTSAEWRGVANLALILVAWMTVASLSMWLLPERFRNDYFAALSAAFLFYIAPLSALLLFAGTLLIYLYMRLPLSGQPSRPLLLVALFSTIFLAGREAVAVIGAAGLEFPGGTDLIALSGIAYYTCRQIHLVLDFWMGRLAPMPLRTLLHYQFFGPVLFVGPIHRIQPFTAQLRERRFDAERLFSGAERVVLGLVAASVIGGYFIDYKLREFLPQADNGFLALWQTSAIDWIALYFLFSGYSAVAIGLAAMAGVRVEENFNRPYLARDLADFWLRWHMTLSHWCRDYVFKPVLALTRRPGPAVLAALVVLGLWHELSLYYSLWGVWQALGIVLWRVVMGSGERQEPKPAGNAGARMVQFVMIFSWLTLAQPVIHALFGWAL